MFGKKKRFKGNTVTLDDVVGCLTLDEKISLLSGKDFWHTQDVPQSRVRIPSVMVSDGPHGLRKQDDSADNLGINDSITAVCFPSAAGLAASFDTEVMTELGKALGSECEAENVAVLLGPAVNIKRSPLCGRNFEYMSEDPYLAGKLASAYIKAVQSNGTGTSLKHFAVNSQEKRRFTVSSEVDERALREIYLPAFETAVKEAQPATIMCAYNRINGEYCSENKRLLTDILRDEWGFRGAVVSDWGAVNNRWKGLLAGVDLEMPGSCGVGAADLKAALERGDITEADIDRSCRRLVNLVFKWVQRGKSEEEPVFDRAAHHELAAKLALSSMVLLKNEKSALPLAAGDKIAFIGEFAIKPRYQGGGSSHVKPFAVTDALSQARQLADITYAKGFGAEDVKTDEQLIKEAVDAAQACGTAVIFAGLPEICESEGCDRRDMRLPDCQNALISRVARTGVKTVVVLHNGSPVEMPWINEVDAVLESYLGGEAVGKAQTMLLFGLANPCGKLAETFPVSYKDVPSYQYFPGTYNTSEHRESIFVGYRYYATAKKRVLFPFGHGLSYTSFEYSDLRVSPSLAPGGKVKVSVTVKNTGLVAGSEAVQIYVSPKNKTVFRSDIELRGFAKLGLEPGESKTAEFELDERAFAWYSVDEGRFVCDDGTYTVCAAASSADVRCSADVTLSGFGTHKCPYPEDINALYSSGDPAKISRADFGRLCGREIVVDKPSAPFTREDCIADLKGTKWGDRIDGLIAFATSKVRIPGQSPDMMYGAAMESPVRWMTAMSQGAFTKEMEDAAVDMMNGRASPAKLAVAALKSKM